MKDRPRIRRALLPVVLLVVVTGCGQEGRFPTAVSPPSVDFGAAAANPGSGDDGAPATLRGHERRHLPRPMVITEAKQALGAVLTGEQAYYQRDQTFTDAADITDLRIKLGVDLIEISHRWSFSVSGASVTGFVAEARGRGETEAKGMVVTLRYVRGQPPAWTIRRRQ